MVHNSSLLGAFIRLVLDPCERSDFQITESRGGGFLDCSQWQNGLRGPGRVGRVTTASRPCDAQTQARTGVTPWRFSQLAGEGIGWEDVHLSEWLEPGWAEVQGD